MLHVPLDEDAGDEPSYIRLERSSFFTETISDTYLFYSNQVTRTIKTIDISFPVAYTYAPVEYAAEPHQAFVRKYLDGPKDILFVGMNPGPFGMCQTGVPFGDVTQTRDWLGITGTVNQPDSVCPNRPILGFNCMRHEISGTKFWGLMREVCETPEVFFKNSFVHNYCPIAYMKSNGNNVAVNEISKVELSLIEAYCDLYLRDTIILLKTRIIVAIGRYAEKCIKSMLQKFHINDKTVYYIPHPSPRVPNNSTWIADTKIRLLDSGLLEIMR